jgi:hypothetical protein
MASMPSGSRSKSHSIRFAAGSRRLRSVDTIGGSAICDCSLHRARDWREGSAQLARGNSGEPAGRDIATNAGPDRWSLRRLATVDERIETIAAEIESEIRVGLSGCSETEPRITRSFNAGMQRRASRHSRAFQALALLADFL